MTHTGISNLTQAALQARQWAWERTKDDFVARVTADFSDDLPGDADAAMGAVFRILDRHISQGEIAQVRNAMRKSLRHLLPAH